jgi:hypothetical protein
MADQNGLDVINDYLKKAFYDSKEPGAYTSASTLWNNVKQLKVQQRHFRTY